MKIHVYLFGLFENTNIMEEKINFIAIKITIHLIMFCGSDS